MNRDHLRKVRVINNHYDPFGDLQSSETYEGYFHQFIVEEMGYTAAIIENIEGKIDILHYSKIQFIS